MVALFQGNFLRQIKRLPYDRTDDYIIYMSDRVSDYAVFARHYLRYAGCICDCPDAPHIYTYTNARNRCFI